MSHIRLLLAFILAATSAQANEQAASVPSVVVGLNGVEIESNWELLVVSSGSMEPTLPRKSYVLSVPAASASTYLNRKTIVSFDVTSSYPTGPYTQTSGKPKFTFLMRIVGLPGDKVELRRGELIVNDVPVAENYILDPSAAALGHQSMPAAIVPVDSVFVLGDNRGYSNDSRFSGPVPISFIRGVIKHVSENTPGSGVADKWRPVK